MSTNINQVTDLHTPSTGNFGVAGNLVLPNTSGNGIKLNTTTPAFGWADILGPIEQRGSGVTVPTFAAFIGNIYAFQFDNTSRTGYVVYHIPHDYVPGTDLFWHVHWAHNSAAVTTGSVTWSYEVSYAKGFDQAAFATPVTGTITQAASTVQYRHMVAEGQISVAGGSATQLNSNNIEVDGLVIIAFTCSANTMSAATSPFCFCADLHYQSTGITTRNKAPNFYA